MNMRVSGAGSINKITNDFDRFQKMHGAIAHKLANDVF